MARLKVTPLKAKIRKKAISSSRKKVSMARKLMAKGRRKPGENNGEGSISGIRYSTRSNASNDVRMETQDRTVEAIHTSTAGTNRPKRVITRKKNRQDEDQLPPDFRTASLLASSAISLGKVFGPFNGEIIEKKRPPSNKHSFVCSICDKNSSTLHFYVHERDRKRCQWLKLVQSPSSDGSANLVAYNSALGVCYRATKAITPGEEILVQYQKDFTQVETTVGTSEVSPSPTQNNNDDEERETSVETIVDKDALLTRDNQSSCANDQIVKSSRALEKDTGDGIKDASPFACASCKVVFESKDLLDTHIRSQLCTKPLFSCSECSKHFITPQAFNKHKAIYHTPARCNSCNVEFVSRKEYLKHAKLIHPKQSKQKQCPICKKIFSASYINDHIQAHNEEAFKCNICGKTFSAKGNLQKHRFRHLPGYKPEQDKRKTEKRFRCDHCNKMFGGVYALEIHLRIHTGERPHECEACSMRFRQVSHLNRHLRISHGQGDDHSKKFKCTICNRGYSCQQTLDLHVITIHKGQRPFQCERCQSSFTQRGNLFRHQREVHGTGSNLPSEECHFTCKITDCQERFGTQAELNEHVISHTGVHPFRCEDCGSNFSSKGNLRKHVRRKHLGEVVDSHKPRSQAKSINCTTCDKAFYTVSQLREHNRMHTGEKISCGKCGQTFSQSSGLRKHLRCLRCPSIREEMRSRGEDFSSSVYPKSRKWQCDICKKCFTGPSDLLSHARVHSGERPFPCHICNRGFSQPGNLKKHIRYVHEGEKRPKDKPRPRKYDCSLCGKAFLSPGDLSMHCRVHSGIKPYQCEDCSMSFSQRGNLKKHMERWHSGQRPKRWRQAEKLKYYKQTKSGDHETYTKPFNADSIKDGIGLNEDIKPRANKRPGHSVTSAPVTQLAQAPTMAFVTVSVASCQPPSIVQLTEPINALIDTPDSNGGMKLMSPFSVQTEYSSLSSLSPGGTNKTPSSSGAVVTTYNSIHHPLASLISNFGQPAPEEASIGQSAFVDAKEARNDGTSMENCNIRNPYPKCGGGNETSSSSEVSVDTANQSSEGAPLREVITSPHQTSASVNEWTTNERFLPSDSQTRKPVFGDQTQAGTGLRRSLSVPEFASRGGQVFNSATIVTQQSKPEADKVDKGHNNSKQMVAFDFDDVITPRDLNGLNISIPVTQNLAKAVPKPAANAAAPSTEYYLTAVQKLPANTTPVTVLTTTAPSMIGTTSVTPERILFQNAQMLVNRAANFQPFVAALNYPQLYGTPAGYAKASSSHLVTGNGSVVTPVVVDGKGLRLATGAVTPDLNSPVSEATGSMRSVVRPSIQNIRPANVGQFPNSGSVQDSAGTGALTDAESPIPTTTSVTTSLSAAISYEHLYCSDNENAANLTFVHPGSLRTVRGIPVAGSSLIAVREPTVIRPPVAAFWAPTNTAVMASPFTSLIPLSNVVALTNGAQPLYLTQPLGDITQDVLVPHDQTFANFLASPDPNRLAQYFVRPATPTILPDTITKQRPQVLISPQTVFPRLSMIQPSMSVSSPSASTTVHSLSLVGQEILQATVSSAEKVSRLVPNTPDSVGKEGLVTPVIIQSGNAMDTTNSPIRHSNPTDIQNPVVYQRFADPRMQNLYRQQTPDHGNAFVVQSLLTNVGGLASSGGSPREKPQQDSGRSLPIEVAGTKTDPSTATLTAPPSSAASSRIPTVAGTTNMYQTPLNSVIVTRQNEQFPPSEENRLASATRTVSSTLLPEIHNLLKDTSSASSAMEGVSITASHPLLTFSSAFGNDQAS